MILAIWLFAVWFRTVNEPTELILPLIVVLIRTIYVDRELPRLAWWFWLTWAVLLMVMITFSGFESALSLFLQVLVGSLLFVHFSKRMKSSRFRRIKWFRDFWLFMSRTFVLAKDRYRDIGYWKQIRLDNRLEGKRFRIVRGYWWSISSKATYAWLVDLVYFAKRFDTVLTSRGGSPVEGTWIHGVEPIGTMYRFMLSDTLIILLMIAPTSIDGFSIVPITISQVLEKI